MRKNLRAGFTLIELMVAMALTLFIMVILSQAFQLALETFAGMKGIADMQENLRTATILLRDDLSQDHFEGKLRVSDLTLTSPRPQAGFFAVVQHSLPGSANYINEGSDTNTMPSFRATDHVLYMTSKRKGNRQESFYTATVPSNNPNRLRIFFQEQTAYNLQNMSLTPTPANLYTMADVTLATPYANGQTIGYYNSQWTEVIYYLKRTGSTEEPHNAASVIGTPTFGLYRAQFVMVPDGTNVSNKFANALNLQNNTFAGMSCNPGPAPGNQLQFYSPADAALGFRVLGANPALFNPLAAVPNPLTNRVINPLPALIPGLTETLVLPNVISFHAKVLPVGQTVPDFVDLGSTAPMVYDTAVAGTAGLRAIQITLRVFDASGTRQTRQVTIVQDL